MPMQFGEQIYAVCGQLLKVGSGKLDDGTPWANLEIGYVGGKVKVTISPDMAQQLKPLEGRQCEAHGVPGLAGDGIKTIKIARLDRLLIEQREVYNRLQHADPAAAAAPGAVEAARRRAA